jgi:lysozyme family protein
VLAHEGGYVTDPHDRGCAINKGITFRVYDAYRSRKGLPTRAVRDLRRAELQEIYRMQYWNAVRGSGLTALRLVLMHALSAPAAHRCSATTTLWP